ncbi:50S ribosomal protein L3, partial [Mycoplasmopsis bovis]|uniref:50S ribosomal protein L3 n=1 Tax=Mycoplasmopsis bovis TaxID=28903 RepID=UPI003D2E9275
MLALTSKGKGFAGTIKRWNQHIGPKSHGGGGGSQPVRQTGSLGDISGNRVVKGMTMPGHLGSEKTTIQNLEIVKVDVANNILLVKGSIPGAK